LGLRGTGEDHITRSFVLFTNYYFGEEIKRNEMGGACGTYRGEERCVQRFGGKA
jgi:hypothetical protein